MRIALEELFDETEHGCIIISTYETFRSYKSVLLTFEWSAVCLDEGQKIKNINTGLISIQIILLFLFPFTSCYNFPSINIIHHPEKKK